MSYTYLKAVCLYCDKTIEGAEERMNKSNAFKYSHGDIVWLERAPEYNWAYYDDLVTTPNGLHRSTRFYLCPDHQTLGHWKEAFRWCKTHTEREEVINAANTEENVRVRLLPNKEVVSE